VDQLPLQCQTWAARRPYSALIAYQRMEFVCDKL
jgi:hypothetical protein